MSVTAKSLVIDILSNHSGGWGNGSTGYNTTQGSFRRILFRLGGQLLFIDYSGGEEYTSYPSAFPATSFYKWLTDSTKSNTGSSYVSLSAAGNFNNIYGDSPQRIVVVFSDIQTFDEIVIHNYHYSGNYTARGLDAVRIFSSLIELDQASADDILGPVAGYLLFEGNILEHVNSDMEFPQYISVDTPQLVSISGEYGAYEGQISTICAQNVTLSGIYGEYTGQLNIETDNPLYISGNYGEYTGQFVCNNGQNDTLLSGEYGVYGGQIVMNTNVPFYISGQYGEYAGQLAALNEGAPVCTFPIFDNRRFC